MTNIELLKFLESAGMNTSGLTPDSLSSKLSEKITLKKFDGDGPINRTDDPIETFVIQDGTIIEHTFGKI